MSRWSLPKKLYPSKKKMWKTITSKLQPKLQTLKLGLPKAITIVKTTTRRFFITVRSLLRFYIPSKLCLTSTKSSSISWPNYHNRGYYNRKGSVYMNNYKNAAIHIDELFAESSKQTKCDKFYGKAETSKRGDNKQVIVENIKGLNYENNNTTTLSTIEDAWKVVVASSPHLRVDERAEEFICKFREDMKLQKERSMLELQQMLARST